DFSADGRRAGAPFLGMPVAAINELDRMLVVGSFLRKDHPLLAARVRAAAKHGCQISVVHAADDELLMPIGNRHIVAPGAWVDALAQIAAAVAEAKGVAAPASGATASDTAKRIASSLLSGKKKAILLGNAAADHPQAAQLHAWAQWLAAQTG